MRPLANSEDPDKMTHNVAFYQGLHCLQNLKWIFRERNKISFENYNGDPSI